MPLPPPPPCSAEPVASLTTCCECVCADCCAVCIAPCTVSCSTCLPCSITSLPTVCARSSRSSRIGPTFSRSKSVTGVIKPARKPTASAPSARPSGFSATIPTPRCATFFTSAPLGSLSAMPPTPSVTLLVKLLVTSPTLPDTVSFAPPSALPTLPVAPLSASFTPSTTPPIVPLTVSTLSCTASLTRDGTSAL